MHSVSAPSASTAMARRAVTWSLAACAAVAIPTLIAPSLPPTATLFNQALALFGWGALLASFANALPERFGPWPVGLKALAAALLLLVVATLSSPLWTGLPYSLALITTGMIAAALLAAFAAAALQQAGSGTQAFRAICVGMLVAATANACIAVAQVYAAPWTDGFWIASVSDARAAGNLRQPNQLCTVLLWGIIAVVWLGESRALRQVAVVPLALLLTFAVMLSGSRMGIVGMLLLALWGLLDRSLSRRARISLLFAPVAYALFWAGAAAWAHYNEQVFGGLARYAAAGALTTSRYGFWANIGALILELPWFGVGPGELNFAWTLTEFSPRSGEYFDHAHNLPLQFAVELGLPLALLVVGLLGWALWTAMKNSLQPAQPGDASSALRPAFAMLAFVLLHSLLEYPLWYSYFLLPTAFVVGLCLGPSRHGSHALAAIAERSIGATLLRPAAVALMVCALFAVLDYFRVVPIFKPMNEARSLDERIAAGQASVLFSHHADYAAAMYVMDPQLRLQAVQRAAHNLLDARLMIAYADALHATGDTERAKYMAQRALEFDPAQAAESRIYFAPCRDPAVKDVDRPYQCFAPQRKFTFKDFR